MEGRKRDSSKRKRGAHLVSQNRELLPELETGSSGMTSQPAPIRIGRKTAHLPDLPDHDSDSIHGTGSSSTRLIKQSSSGKHYGRRRVSQEEFPDEQSTLQANHNTSTIKPILKKTPDAAKEARLAAIRSAVQSPSSTLPSTPRDASSSSSRNQKAQRVTNKQAKVAHKIQEENEYEYDDDDFDKVCESIDIV